MQQRRRPRLSRPRLLTGLSIAGLVAAAGLAGCGGSAATATASEASCVSALTPWVLYIADTSDFKGWVATVGANNPVVLLPQMAAKVYLGEESKVGINKASQAGLANLDQGCAGFAVKYPSFDFVDLPAAPTPPT